MAHDGYSHELDMYTLEHIITARDCAHVSLLLLPTAKGWDLAPAPGTSLHARMPAAAHSHEPAANVYNLPFFPFCYTGNNRRPKHT